MEYQFLNAAARKVLDATPKTEAWSVGQICGELSRKGLSNNHAVVRACLQTLQEHHLVKEPAIGSYIQTPQRPRISKAKEPVAAQPEPTQSPEVPSPPKAPTLDRISEMSATLRTQAAQLIAMAGQLDDVAIEVEERIQRINSDSVKLRRFQQMFRELSED